MNANRFTSPMPDLLVRLWYHFSLRRQRQFGLLLILMLISAFAEAVSLGTLLPFIGILTAPDMLFKRPLIAHFARVYGVTSPDHLALPLTVAFVAAAVVAGAIRMLLLWVNTRLAFAAGADLSMEAYRRTLYQPYRVHVLLNSSAMISGITKKLDDVVYGMLLPFLTLVSSSVLLVAIVLILIAINPLVATMAAVGFGASYGLITWMSRHRLLSNSRRIADEQTQVIKSLQEGLGGIRDVLLDGTQPVYCNIYRHADLPLRRAQGENVFIGGSPRFLLEAVGMALIAGMTYALRRQTGGVTAALPALGALALGAQRLLPALQQIYGSWTNICGSRASLSDTIEMLDQPISTEMLQPASASLRFEESIRFDAVRFRYARDGPWVLDGLNLTFRKGARVGFVGSTGSGKSTALDVLMGLLTPAEGSILVDGRPILGSHIKAWQKTIAHVPQVVYLADTTLIQNIAFGVPPESINVERVRKVARQAQIADFIEASPKGYYAYVGERGVRLSGGQRQRIGLARALYKQASVLVFDEATSALDNATERAIMDAIEGLDRELTIFLIAHRLTTVRRCDTLIELERGRAVAQGTYEELLQRSPSFRQMARTDSP